MIRIAKITLRDPARVRGEFKGDDRLETDVNSGALAEAEGESGFGERR